MSEKTCKYKHDGEWCWAQKNAPRCYHDAGLKECEDDKPVYVPPIITNADRIRSMSDEELAEFISDITNTCESNTECNQSCYGCDKMLCELSKCITWLKQEWKE